MAEAVPLRAAVKMAVALHPGGRPGAGRRNGCGRRRFRRTFEEDALA